MRRCGGVLGFFAAVAEEEAWVDGEGEDEGHGDEEDIPGDAVVADAGGEDGGEEAGAEDKPGGEVQAEGVFDEEGGIEGDEADGEEDLEDAIADEGGEGIAVEDGGVGAEEVFHEVGDAIAVKVPENSEEVLFGGVVDLLLGEVEEEEGGDGDEGGGEDEFEEGSLTEEVVGGHGEEEAMRTKLPPKFMPGSGLEGTVFSPVEG